METTLLSTRSDQTVHMDVTAMNEAVICSQTLQYLGDNTQSLVLDDGQSCKNLREAYACYQEARHALDVIDNANMQELVDTLNAIGATPNDLICILRNLKTSGALFSKLDSI